MRFISIVLLGCFFFCLTCAAQKGVTTMGIQFKPMIPSKFFGSGKETGVNGELSVDFTPRVGFNFGMVVRRGITEAISFETGIALVQRNYDLDFIHTHLDVAKQLDFRFIGYEIPILGLVYVQIGDQLWMNAAGGFSVDMYPSNVVSEEFFNEDSTVYDFEQTTFRNGWLQFALLANYGFEWRTKENGYFYLGASYHRPFADIAETVATFREDGESTKINKRLSGSYLTADLRYFFHEDPEKTARKKKGK